MGRIICGAPRLNGCGLGGAGGCPLAEQTGGAHSVSATESA